MVLRRLGRWDGVRACYPRAVAKVAIPIRPSNGMSRILVVMRMRATGINPEIL